MIKDIGTEGPIKTNAMILTELLKPGQAATPTEPREWYMPVHTLRELYGNKNIKDKG